MMRVEQRSGTRGSLKWIQRLVQHHPDLLNDPLQQLGALEVSDGLKWLSPLPDDGWAEYRDLAFLERIGHETHADSLREYWPRRGPQWDALAKDRKGRVYLFEAKAHAAELASTCQAGAASRQKINKAIDFAKGTFGADPASDWLNGYYQYANRLAHLTFLGKHGIDARLICLYFTDDQEMSGPSSESAWRPFIDAAHAHLGLLRLPEGVVELFVDVKDLA